MGLFDWFSALSKGDEKAVQAASISQRGGIKDDSIVHGLDFVAAIEAHRKWKERLAAYVDGTSTEKLDNATICRDDQCALGKWIYADGATFMGHMPLFHSVKAKHAEFHINAAQVVEQVQRGQKESAATMLHEGAFTKSSREVQSLISRLYMEMKGQ